MTAGDLTTREGWCTAQETATVEVDGHAVEQAHFDRGTGEPVVFLHGIPTGGSSGEASRHDPPMSTG